MYIHPKLPGFATVLAVFFREQFASGSICPGGVYQHGRLHRTSKDLRLWFRLLCERVAMIAKKCGILIHDYLFAYIQYGTHLFLIAYLQV